MKFVAIIPTLNAAEHLPDCLAALRGCDYIWLWDQGSTDGTLEIAAAAGAIVRPHPPWGATGEYPMRNLASRSVRERFPDVDAVLCLDSDEILTDHWRAELEDTYTRHPNAAAIQVPYWQLIGDVRWSQVGNPIERRIVSCRVGRGPFFQEGGGWHSCRAEATGDTYDVIHPILIHLGYTGDIRRRWRYNRDRGDWTGDPGEWIETDPWSRLPSVLPTPNRLFRESAVLRTIYHTTCYRKITTAPIGTAFAIKDITYAKRPLL